MLSFTGGYGAGSKAAKYGENIHVFIHHGGRFKNILHQILFLHYVSL